jgi:hypothetical protein
MAHNLLEQTTLLQLVKEFDDRMRPEDSSPCSLKMPLDYPEPCQSAPILIRSTSICIQVCRLVVLGGIMVSVLAILPGFAGSNPAEGDGFLGAVKVRSTPSLGLAVGPM